MLEQEYRYLVNERVFDEIKKICNEVESKQRQIDLTLGQAGFDSLYKYGYVCRVRQKGNRIWMEVKNKKDGVSFLESKVDIHDFATGVNFFIALGMKAYMYMKRTREILNYKGLKIFLDDIEFLGKYVEIEFQGLQNAESLINEFLDLVGIKSEPQPLYGDILKERLATDKVFETKYNEKLAQFIKEETD